MRALLPFTSLDGASTPGPGAARDLECVARRHTVVVSTTGGPTTAQGFLEGSLDGQTWFSLSGFNVGSSGIAVYTTSEQLVRYVRANLTQLSGGTNPTATALIASAEE